VLDYNTNFKSAGQLVSLYAPDQFRIGDHDPVLLGLNLTQPWPFGGLLEPVTGTGRDPINAGSTVPVRFSLGGYRGMNIFATGFPTSIPVDCAAPGAAGSQAAGRSARAIVNYDAEGDTYGYIWKTDKAWAGTCRELILKFMDDAVYRIPFSFR